MLNVLRESFKRTPYLKWVLIAVAVGMVLYLGNYLTGDPGSARSWVARVNGKEIDQLQFRDAARALDQYYRQLFGANYEQFQPQLQIRDQALQAIIEKELILQDARRLGLHSSAADIAEQIRNHPSFQDATGQFIGIERYRQLVERSVSGGVGAFEQGLADDLLAARWTNLVTEPVSVSDEELEEIFRARTEKTSMNFVIAASADQKIDANVDDDELRKWYEAHLDDYQRGEGRRIRYVVVDREAQRALLQIGADEVREYYETNQALYTHPEQRQASHILFQLAPDASDEDRQRVREQAEQVLERLQAGEDFATLARALSQDVNTADLGGDLGYIGRGEMFESFEEAAFATPVGQVAPITETPYGLHIIQVTDSRPAGVAPLDQVEEPIRRALELRRADEQVASEAERLRAALASAEDLQQVAEQEGLTVESHLLFADEGMPELGASAEFISGVSRLEPGAVSSPLRVAAGMAVVVVDEVVAPGPAPLEEIRSSVSTDILNERTREAAVAAARRAHERHGDLASVAEALGAEVQESGDLAPGQGVPGTGGSNAELQAALFGPDAETGNKGVVAVPSGALVYEITRREPFDAQSFDLQKGELRNQTLADRRNRYRQSILNQLRNQYEIETNDAFLESLAPAG